MITLYAAGPAYGLPEGSPYVTKTEIHLKMAGLWYRKEPARPDTSPKGQLPWIDDDGVRVADSTFIRAYIERSYGVDLDAGLSKAERAQAWAIERMVENHLGWASCHFRFFEAENFEKGPAHWFDGAPEEMREGLKAGLLDAVGANLKAVGIARHSPEEILELGSWSLSALSEMLGRKSFMMGHRPTSVDAIVFAMLAQILTPFFDSPLRRRAESFPNLVAYAERMMAGYYPEFAPQVCEAA
ncbi:MAG: glutathione S-transferase family protein [Caulobacter sp.]|nr:glutathione S-transferase family protein [Caulobacter sp.]